MGTIFAIANQKGGVGKTTTAVNVAASVAEAGQDTLLVDLDPQCNATVGLGLPKDATPNAYDCLAGDATVADTARPTAFDRLWAVPATPDLAGAAMELPRMPGSETRLREQMGPVRDRFLLTLLDCPPSLGPITVNALVAADRVIVPVQTEYFALEGLAGLLDTLSLIQRELNPRLTVAGMILTMHDGRTRLAQDVEREVRSHFPDLVFDTVIPATCGWGRHPATACRASATRRRAPARPPTSSSPGRWPPVPPDESSEARGSNARGMGRGLSAILPRSRAEEVGFREVALDLIVPNPRQPRREFDEAALLALADSIRSRGVLQPIVVRPVSGGTFELVADLGLTKGEVGRRVGRSRVAVSNLIRLLDLPEEALEQIEAGALSEGHGRAILTCKDHEHRKRLARDAREHGWSVRETERRSRALEDGEDADSQAGREPTELHPDLADALAAAEDALTAALGQPVSIRAAGESVRAELRFDSPGEAIELAERLLRRRGESLSRAA